MTTGQVVGIEIEAVAWDDASAAAVGRRRMDYDGPLDRDAVTAHVVARFGAPSGTAGSSDSWVGGVPVGWTYPITCHPELSEMHPDTTLVIIPYACFADGTRRELLLSRPLPRPRPRPAAEEEHVRLEHQSPKLTRSDRMGVTFELHRWLRELLADGNTYLVIEIGDRYVQFVAYGGDWLRGEVVGPAHLPDRPLSPDERNAILDIGWLPPDEEIDDGNFWMEWGDPDVGIPVDLEDAAEFAAATLCLAFGPFCPDDARVSTGAAAPPAEV